MAADNVLQEKSSAEQKKDEGNELYKSKNYREALQRYSEAISLSPESSSFYGNRSACYLMLSQPEKALEDARTAVNIDPGFLKGYIRMAKCCISLGNPVEAMKAVEQGLQIDGDNETLKAEKEKLDRLHKLEAGVDKAQESKDYRTALYYLDQCLVVADASVRHRLRRAECLVYLGRYLEAQEVTLPILSKDNRNVEAIYVRGLCLYYEDHLEKAFNHFQQLLKLAPDHVKAKETLKRAKHLKRKKDEGNEAFKAQKHNEAHKLYTEALVIDPNNRMTVAKLYFNRGTVAARLGRHEDAVSDCTSALELDEAYLKAIVRRAHSYMSLEKYEEAVQDFEKAHRLDKANMEYRRNLQHAKLELKKSKRKDYYKILGVSKDCNDDEIKKAYKKRAMVHHPDRHSNATEQEKKEHEMKFKEVGEAYGVLSDAKKRSRYDGGHDLEDLDGGHPGHHMDPNQIFQAFFASGGMGPGCAGPGCGGQGQQGFNSFFQYRHC